MDRLGNRLFVTIAMKPIVEKDDSGNIVIPPEAAGPAKPHTRYEVEQDGNALRLVPVEEPRRLSVEELQAEAKRYWAETTPEQRASDFLEWVRNLQPKAPHLPDEALSRESLYD